MYTNGSEEIIQYSADNIFLSVAKVCKNCENPISWSRTLDWRFEIQTLHRDRKATTSNSIHKLLARNSGLSGEIRVRMNDPEEMTVNLSEQIEYASMQHCQKCMISR